MMKTFVLNRQQWLPKPIEEVFAFFADAQNLAEITPAWLRFRILSPQPITMGEGTLIVYRLRWHGLPLRWITEITQWEPPGRFVDVQQKGPYALWQHTHEFEAEGGGTLMCDLVRYGLPLGCLSSAVHRLIVRRDLDAIFDHRARTVDELFAGTGGARLNETTVSQAGIRGHGHDGFGTSQ